MWPKEPPGSLRLRLASLNRQVPSLPLLVDVVVVVIIVVVVVVVVEDVVLVVVKVKVGFPPILCTSSPPTFFVVLVALVIADISHYRLCNNLVQPVSTF